MNPKNHLVALSSAAVMTIYAAGFIRTRSAAARLEAAERPRVVIPDTPATGAPREEGIPEVAPAPVVASSTTAATTAAATPAPTVSSANAPAKPRKARATTADASKPATSQTATATTTPTSSATETTPAAGAPTASAATTTPEPTPTPTPTPAPGWKDGTYSGWGTSRHGDIEATVVIDGGKITSAVISQCWTRYSCSWVAHLQAQVVTRQSPEVDWVTGATQSVNAFYYAVVQALSKAK